jgi:uncharacterized protein YcbK (DUF882 family)
MRLPGRLVAALLFVTAPMLAVASFPNASSGAEVVHTVTKGQTIDQVAKKYGVTPKQLIAANKLKDPSHLKAGTKLTIPKVSASAAKSAQYVAVPKHAGRVKFIRFGTSESQELQLVSKKGKLTPGVLPKVSRMMRFGKLNIEHVIDAKLVQNLATVSDHFGGRSIEIISGFRPKTPTQYTPHSNHNVGKAIDMRMAGVPNEVLRDYCRTFKNVGVGYYPNSLFVHFDVRKQSTFWVDLSKPGEPPKYVGAATDVDHGTDDVSVEGPDVPVKETKDPKDEAPVPAASGSAPAKPAGSVEGQK